MKIDEIILKLNNIIPEGIQEPYDNTGSQIIFNDDVITNIYISLDVDFKTIDDAILNGCNLIICHHPLLFRPLKKITSNEARSRIIIKLIESKVSLFSMHTNYDKVMYKTLSDTLGYKDCDPLIKTNDIADCDTGFGSVIFMDKEEVFSDVLKKTKDTLELEYLIYSGDLNSKISSIAFINGSGGGSIEKIISSTKPDCVVTGDVGYHQAKYAIDSGVALIDAGHYGTEYIFKKMLAQTVRSILYDESIKIVISDVEKNPFKVY